MQWVDFYLSEYRPKPLSFDSRFAFFAFIAVAFVLLLFGIWQSLEANRFASLVEKKQQQLTQTEAQIKAMQASLTALEQQQDTHAILSKKREELAALSKVVKNLRQKAANQAIPYSQVLTDLSQQTADKLWLTRIILDQGVLSLQGSTTRRESIPGYIENLNQAESLAREFSGLSIEKDDQNRRLIHFKLEGGVKHYGD